MLKILCPTDFSNNSRYACEYAIDLANKLNAQLTFLTTYDSAVVDSIKSIEEKIREATEEDLHYFVNKLKPLIKSGIEPQLIVKDGDASDQILYYAASSKQSVVIMGTKGSSSLLSMLMGSVTRSVIKNATIPVLAIPIGTKDELVGNDILLALDEKGINNLASIDLLKALTTLPNTTLSVFHVVILGEQVKLDPTSGSLEGIVKEIIEVDGVDPVMEIKKYIDQNKSVGLLAMVNRKHTFLERAFFESNTIAELFSTNVPILFLPEIN